MAGIPSFIHSFGSVQFSQNANIKASGENNSGSIQSNSNLFIAATKCQLDISSTSNAKIEAEKSKLGCRSSPNLQLKGKLNDAVLENNPNLRFQGDGNNVNAVSNTNLKLYVNSTSLKLFNNKNADIQMNGGEVHADDNINLRISGNGGSVQVKGTKNHFIHSLLGKPGAKEGQNEVEVKPSCSVDICDVNSTFNTRGWLSSVFSGWSRNTDTNVKYSLTYIDSIQVDGSNYKLDDLNFTIEPKTDSQFSVKLADNNLDPGSLSVTTISPNEYLVSATKRGKKLACKFSAPVIIPSGDNQGSKFTLDMGKGATSHI